MRGRNERTDMTTDEMQRREGGGGFAWSKRAGRAARNRWLPQGRRGPMPWIIAIMMFLTVLAGAGSLSLAQALHRMHGELAGGQTVQIVEADAAKRADQVRKVAALLRADGAIRTVHVVPEERLLAQLEPWIGTDAGSGDLPIPALIDMELAPGATPARLRSIAERVEAAAPSARIDSHENYLGPVERLMRIAMWLIAGLMALMLMVTGAVVTLAARSAHATHRGTIDIMHLLGATDLQIARLFQRRMALDALFGGALGLGAAAVLLWLLGRAIFATGSELTQMMVLSWRLAALLLLIPACGTVLAMLIARITVRRALERSL